MSSFPSHMQRDFCAAERLGDWHTDPSSESKQGGEFLGLLTSSLLLLASFFVQLCRFLVPWTYSYMLTLVVIKDHETKEMFCSLTRCFVLLCLEIVPTLTQKKLINISPDRLLSLLSYLNPYFSCNEKSSVPPSSNDVLCLF